MVKSWLKLLSEASGMRNGILVSTALAALVVFSTPVLAERRGGLSDEQYEQLNEEGFGTVRKATTPEEEKQQEYLRKRGEALQKKIDNLSPEQQEIYKAVARKQIEKLVKEGMDPSTARIGQTKNGPVLEIPGKGSGGLKGEVISVDELNRIDKAEEEYARKMNRDDSGGQFDGQPQILPTGAQGGEGGDRVYNYRDGEMPMKREQESDAAPKNKVKIIN
jgi:cell division protein FtsB